MLILASRSPRRAELLRAAGIRFRIVPPPEEERAAPRVRANRAQASPSPGRSIPALQVRRAALAKARSVAVDTNDVALGADTIVVCNGIILGKPASRAEARRMLELLSGRWHTVYTGLALVWGKRYKVGHERTEVAFRRLSKGEIARYLSRGEPMDKAGAYAIQGEGAAFVRVIRGCYTNVIGLPLPKLVRMLEDLHKTGVAKDGSSGWQTWEAWKRARH